MPSLVEIRGVKDPNELNRLWSEYARQEYKSGFRNGIIWGIAIMMSIMGVMLMLAKGWFK